MLEVTTKKYYSSLVLYVPICVSVPIFTFVVNYTNRESGGDSEVGIQAFWMALCFSAFAGLVEKLIRRYFTEVAPEGLTNFKWARRKSHLWSSLIKAEWGPLVVRLFTTGSAEVNFLIVRDRKAIANRIVAGLRNAGGLSDAELDPSLPRLSSTEKPQT